MEKWTTRRVTDMGGMYPYGCVRFKGEVYEPTTHHGFIRVGNRVEVRRLTGTGRIAVRMLLRGGAGFVGGEETWTT